MKNIMNRTADELEKMQNKKILIVIKNSNIELLGKITKVKVAANDIKLPVGISFNNLKNAENIEISIFDIDEIRVID